MLDVIQVNVIGIPINQSGEQVYSQAIIEHGYHGDHHTNSGAQIYKFNWRGLVLGDWFEHTILIFIPMRLTFNWQNK